MDNRQGTLPDQSVWEFDWTDIHHVGGDRLPKPQLSKGISPLVFLHQLLSSVECEFCAAFILYCTFFSVFSGESIRREYASYTPKGSFLDGGA